MLPQAKAQARPECKNLHRHGTNFSGDESGGDGNAKAIPHTRLAWITRTIFCTSDAAMETEHVADPVIHPDPPDSPPSQQSLGMQSCQIEGSNRSLASKRK